MDAIEVDLLVDEFVSWINDFDNQPFGSVQDAYVAWLQAYGLEATNRDYSTSVQVILVFLSRCIANPRYCRYLSNPNDEPDRYTPLQVNIPTSFRDRTHWEFLTESAFGKMCADRNR